MSKHKFSKPPESALDREKRAEAFVNLTDNEIDKESSVQQPTRRLKKEKTKAVYLRAPESLWEDIHEIVAITGLTMNAVCLELLRPAIKQKLKELKE